MAARHKSIKGLNASGEYTSVKSSVVAPVPQIGGGSQTFASAFGASQVFPSPQVFVPPFGSTPFGATPFGITQPMVIQTQQVVVPQQVKINIIFTQFPDFRTGTLLLNSNGSNFVQIERKDGNVVGSVVKFLHSHGLTGKIGSSQFQMVINGENQYTVIVTNTTPITHHGHQFISNLRLLPNVFGTQFVRSGHSNILIGGSVHFMVSASCFDILQHFSKELSSGNLIL